ncbi:MAG: SCO6745 family protein [Ilumatobacteraceae bacterium]
MTSTTADDWRDLSARAGFASHRLIGWIYWDPEAIANYTALGVPNGFGYYIASRGASLADGGNDVVVAAFYSIHAGAIAACLDVCREHTTFADTALARDAAVTSGLRGYVPEICDDLASMGPDLWAAADSLPISGRPLFASLLRRRREDDPLLSAWLAVNCIREWRGDTHWALHIAEDIGPIEAGILDGAWRSYEQDWVPRSRGADDAALDAAYERLAGRGFADGSTVTTAGIEFRQRIEDRLDDLASAAWQHLGEAGTRRFLDLIEPVGDRLIARVDETAGTNWMPAGRRRPETRR